MLREKRLKMLTVKQSREIDAEWEVTSADGLRGSDEDLIYYANLSPLLALRWINAVPY